MDELSAQLSSKLNGLTREFNIITHNLANAGTAGYKRRCNAFSKSLMEQESAVGTSGEVSLSTSFDFSQGEVVHTGRSLDFALCGKGFFVVETPDGPLYTRNGLFHLNQNGQIVDSSGRIVAGEAGPISIPSDTELSQISVSSDGSISANGTAIGKFKLVDFKDRESELVAVGANCFQAPDDISAATPENLIVKQGFQESSNVRMVEELVDMMMVSKLYEASVKFISAKKDVSQSIIGVAMA
jgi:flagellar basal-body rod protein FlgF